MNKYWLGLFLSLLIAVTVWAQGTSAPFDMAKTQKELEIMKGIFNTTLSFNSEDSQRDPIFHFADIRFLYLPDQGVNFYVQNPGFSPPNIAWDDIKFQFDEAALHTNLENLGINLERMQENLKTQVLSLEELYSDHSRSEKAEEKALEARSDIEEEKERIKQHQEAVEAQRAEMLERQKEMKQQIEAQKEKAAKQQEEQRQKLSEMKDSLMEAVANYGDSLTTVKSDEYINLVFDTHGQYDVVSIQKSWIRDFKAGRLTLDQLKGKAIQYSMEGR